MHTINNINRQQVFALRGSRTVIYTDSLWSNCEDKLKIWKKRWPLFPLLIPFSTDDTISRPFLAAHSRLMIPIIPSRFLLLLAKIHARLYNNLWSAYTNTVLWINLHVSSKQQQWDRFKKSYLIARKMTEDNLKYLKMIMKIRSWTSFLFGFCAFWLMRFSYKVFSLVVWL